MWQSTHNDVKRNMCAVCFTFRWRKSDLGMRTEKGESSLNGGWLVGKNVYWREGKRRNVFYDGKSIHYRIKGDEEMKSGRVASHPFVKWLSKHLSPLLNKQLARTAQLQKGSDFIAVTEEGRSDGEVKCIEMNMLILPKPDFTLKSQNNRLLLYIKA